MIHYHGGRHSTWQVAVEIWKRRHALVSYADHQQIAIAAEVAQSFALDNGAFSVWKQGIAVDWKGYYAWVEEWWRHPGFDWAVKGSQILIMNPLESHRLVAARSLRERKTDTADARSIRMMVLQGIGRPFIETDEVLALKALVTERDGMVDIQSILKNRREARMVRSQAIVARVYDPSAPVMAAIAGQILMLEAQLLQYSPATQHLLQSIPGIGPVSAAALVAHIGDIRRFSSPQKLVAYIGLDCKIRESGTSVKGRRTISKRGNHRLRTVLFQATFIARQHNPEFKRYFERKQAEGKHYMTALTAVERKLIHLIYAVWTRGTPFEKRNAAS